MLQALFFIPGFSTTFFIILFLVVGALVGGLVGGSVGGSVGTTGAEVTGAEVTGAAGAAATRLVEAITATTTRDLNIISLDKLEVSRNVVKRSL